MITESVKITVLAENTAQGVGIIGEHGLSLWIETGAGNILFDTGQGMALPHNAECLGIDLSSAQMIVISHGHYDHTGGLPYAMEHAPTACLMMHPDALISRYSYREGTARAIGLPQSAMEAVNSRQFPVTWITKPTEVAPGVFVTGPIPRVNGYEDTGGPFYLDEKGSRPDPITDDQAMWLETTQGLVVILGCAHSGVINTLGMIKTLRPNDPIHTVIGGMHLANASESRMDQTMVALREFDITRIMPIHCSGFFAQARLHREFPDSVTPCPAGSHIIAGAIVPSTSRG